MEPPPIPFKFAPEQTGMNFTTMPIPPTQTQGFPQTSSASNNSNLQPLTNLETSIPPIPSLNNPQHPLYQQNPHFPPSLQQIPVTTNSPDLNSRDSIISNASTSQFYNVAQNQQQVPPILSSQPQQQPDFPNPIPNISNLNLDKSNNTGQYNQYNPKYGPNNPTNNSNQTPNYYQPLHNPQQPLFPNDTSSNSMVMPDFSKYVNTSKTSNTPPIPTYTQNIPPKLPVKIDPIRNDQFNPQKNYQPMPQSMKDGRQTFNGDCSPQKPRIYVPQQPVKKDERIANNGYSTQEPYVSMPQPPPKRIPYQDNSYASMPQPPIKRDGSSSYRESLVSSHLKFLMNPTLLSHIALEFRSTVKFGNHIKGALEYPNSFTGADVVKTIQSTLPPEAPKHVALHIARSLEAQLYFNPINWSSDGPLKDSNDEVYVFFNQDLTSLNISELDEDFPTGVFPTVGKCYSPCCGLYGKGCYSILCPNYVPVEGTPADLPLIRKTSLESIESPKLSAPTLDKEQDRTWSGAVPKEILESVSKEELKRQEIIYETIYTENDYIKDLYLIEEVYIKGIRNSPEIMTQQTKIEKFIDDVFYNIFEIRAQNEILLEKLKARQKENYVVNEIGDLFLEWAFDAGNKYVRYNGRIPIVDSLIKTEKARNPKFKQFMEECMRSPKTRKLDFRHYIQRPTGRLQRYTLFLEQIIKHTSNNSQDKDLLDTALQVIKELCRESDSNVSNTERKLKLEEIGRKLKKKNGESLYELSLNDDSRQLVFKGELHSKMDNSLKWTTLYVFVFDHYLVITKPKKASDGEIEYVLHKPIIPLDKLLLDNVSEVNQQKLKLTGLENYGKQSYCSFTLSHIGKNGGTYQLYAETINSWRLWKDKIIEAQNKLDLMRSKKQVFELFTLNDATFTNLSVGAPANIANLQEEKTKHFSRGKVNCSIPFSAPENCKMIAVGTEEGVWIGFGGETKTFRKVLNVGNVSQIAVIEEFGIFIVLVEKSLWAYPLEALIPSSLTADFSQCATRQRISDSNNVSYFKVGTTKEKNTGAEKTLLVYMKKKNLNYNFSVLEPAINLNEVDGEEPKQNSRGSH
ncbi:15488_t:CDS:10 [Entrophospora sp. SA101]|nr:15488_t:CDS:10 [Entrophospora sp. SA101]CAJ0841367.1 2989_t:CDS:10 [Entrophospora sp. SA101]